MTKQVTSRRPPDVVAWRETRLRQAGIDREMASWLARGEAIDLHALLELIDRGCPPDLAVRILAPLEGERRLS